MFFKPMALAAALFAAGLAAPSLPALAAASDLPAPQTIPAPVQPQGPLVIVGDPARLQTTQTIMTNLRIYEVMVHMGQRYMLEPGGDAYTPAQKTLLSQAFADAMAKRRANMIHKLAASVRGDFSQDQLNNIEALSRVRYIQDLVAQGADAGLVADAGSMTVADQNLVRSIGSEPYVNLFANAIDYGILKDDIAAAMTEAHKATGL